MSTVNLPTVSAKIVGDASGLRTELKSAEQATSVASAKMQSELHHFGQMMSRTFSLGHLGRELLRGLGIYGGFHLAEKAAELISEHYKEAAESAKEVAEMTAKQLETTKELISLRRTDEQNYQAMLRERDDLTKKVAAINRPRMETITVATGQGMTTQIQRQHELTKDELKERQELMDQLNVVSRKVAEVEKSKREKELKADEDWIKDIQKTAAAIEKETRTPFEKFQQKLSELNSLLGMGAITEDTYNRARKQARNEYKEDMDKLMPKEKEGAKPAEPLTDRLLRVGLLTGMGNSLNDPTQEAKKQTTLLAQILEEIRSPKAVPSQGNLTLQLI